MKKFTFDSIIFDMDGVLIDVSQSYRLAIKKTVLHVLSSRYNVKTTVKTQDIETMKRIPGFNNDWDVSFELIRLLSNGITRREFSKKFSLVSSRDTQEYNTIKDIFQNYYLGTELFYKIYKRKAPIKAVAGLITNENLLIDKSLLVALSQRYTLGIATSRPRFEALFTLRNVRIIPEVIYEEYLVAQEDSVNEKPAPDPLLEVQRRMKTNNPIYVGDSINDTIASQAAQMKCIFIGKDSYGDIQVSDVNQIQRLFL